MQWWSAARPVRRRSASHGFGRSIAQPCSAPAPHPSSGHICPWHCSGGHALVSSTDTACTSADGMGHACMLGPHRMSANHRLTAALVKMELGALMTLPTYHSSSLQTACAPAHASLAAESKSKVSSSTSHGQKVCRLLGVSGFDLPAHPQRDATLGAHGLGQ